jgi:hypothetical protein
MTQVEDSEEPQDDIKVTCIHCKKPLVELTHDGKTYWAHDDSYSRLCDQLTAIPNWDRYGREKIAYEARRHAQGDS